jgi:hypothetical protein
LFEVGLSGKAAEQHRTDLADAGAVDCALGNGD